MKEKIYKRKFSYLHSVHKKGEWGQFIFLVLLGQSARLEVFWYFAFLFGGGGGEERVMWRSMLACW